jgi:pyruvate/2-oxoglutarate/acetoin dehydrogenase E1 component
MLFSYNIILFPFSFTGVAIGYAQAGLVPIVEIPYAKYLDCGADMFYEAVYANWYSNGRQPNGMIIRLQGFGRGVFGGNFHTHNNLYLPPGLDVVCYSNGADYARGFRCAVEQARGMVV